MKLRGSVAYGVEDGEVRGVTGCVHMVVVTKQGPPQWKPIHFYSQVQQTNDRGSLTRFEAFLSCLMVSIPERSKKRQYKTGKNRFPLPVDY